MTTKRKTLTKSLHTVTAVSRLAAHLEDMWRERYVKHTPHDLVRQALGILGQPEDWPIGDETFNRCLIATRNLIRSNKS